MDVQTGTTPDAALTVVLEQREVELFRTAVERALFIDTPPHLQSATMDLLHELLEKLQAAEGS
jgi:hypothetical protein